MATIPTTAIASTGKLFEPDDDGGGEKSMRETVGEVGSHEEGVGLVEEKCEQRRREKKQSEEEEEEVGNGEMGKERRF